MVSEVRPSGVPGKGEIVKKILLSALLLCLALIAGCGSDNTNSNQATAYWTWMSGDNSTLQAGSYGTKGIPSPTNKPGARYGAVSWTDNSGNMWLFGGEGYDGIGNLSYLNDLWRWDGANWTWISGPSTGNTAANYGTKGVAVATNIPGGRKEAVSWVDNTGNFWLFGGQGIVDTSGNGGWLNDLWRWDGANWTWVSGDNILSQAGVYGTKGTVAAGNKPGGRSGAVSWKDQSGNLWLFGGLGYDTNGTWSYLNDLWKWDGTNWTWMSGSNLTGQYGSYGTKGVSASSNTPGSRRYAVSLVDRNGSFWLFGGDGQAKSVSGYLNDLWKWDGTNWIWVAGDDQPTISATYGTKGIAAPTNKIGGRMQANAWIDNSGNFLFFGGNGTAGNGVTGSSLNDLWRWDGTYWTWVAGDSSSAQGGIYGTKGVTSATNTPGARYGASSWIDKSGDIWMFGGYGYASTTFPGYLNDLWRYK